MILPSLLFFFQLFRASLVARRSLSCILLVLFNYSVDVGAAAA